MQDKQQIFFRDGTSQLQRLLTALKEGYIGLEERGIEDWLRYARRYAAELNYFNLENQPTEDWSGFLSGEVEEMLAYLEDPKNFDQQPDKQERLSRPHFVLFLTFLKLLEENHKPALNQVLWRHLDHYYRELLQFDRKSATPDRVFVIVQLAKNFRNDRFLLSENTHTFAGKDPAGKDLIYPTEDNLMVNRTAVEELKSVYVDRQVNDFTVFGLPQQLPSMVALALGELVDPDSGQTLGVLKPGGTLPVPGFLGVNENPSDKTLFDRTNDFLNFAGKVLNISFAALRKLLRLKQNRDHDENEWDLINAELATMRTGGNAAFSNLRNFPQNFLDATSYSPVSDAIYNELQNVNNAYELYEELNFSTTGDYARFKPLAGNPLTGYADIAKVGILRAFITEKFYPPTANPAQLNQNANRFHRMMQLRVAIREEWMAMQELLSNIPQPPGEAVFTDIEAPEFEELLDTKYGGVDFTASYTAISSIDAYYQTLVDLEDYFALTAEEVKTLLTHALDPPGEETVVYELLNKAHQNKPSIIRRQQLAGTGTNIELLFRLALGRSEPGDNYPALPRGASDLNDLYDQLAHPDPVVRENAAAYIEQQLLLPVADFRFILEVHRDQVAGPNNSAPDWQWRRVYRLLEKAERKLRGPFPKSRPEIVRLNGLYAHADATQARTGSEEETFPRWRTFGAARNRPPASLGLVVRSILLYLSAGERTVTLDVYPEDTLTATQLTALESINEEPDEDGRPRYPFRVEVSGEKEWLAVPSFEVVRYQELAGGEKGLRIQFVLPPDFDPVTVLPSDAEGCLGPYPALRVLLDRPGMILGEFSAHDLFSRFEIKKADLSVQVSSLTPTFLRNDTAELVAEEAFEPFGNTPKPGGRLYFSHPELTFKQLDTISPRLNWLGTPNWPTQYVNYSQGRTDSNVFVAHLRLLDQGVERQFKATPTDTSEKTIKLFGGTGDDNLLVQMGQELDANSSFAYRPLPADELPNDLFEHKRYFFLQLGTVDFGHAEYPRLATQKANELAIAIAGGPINDAGPYQVYPPYTPQLQDFTISYTAGARGLGSEQSDGNAELVHIHPFGYEGLGPTGDHTFLPAYTQEGYLYIGLRDLDPPFDLALLFQMAEGSADPDIVPPPLDWRYLVDEKWEKVDQKGRIISDGTNGLLNSGIIKLRIPAEANTRHTQLPAGLYWLRASVRANSAGLNDVVGIHPHAVAAVFRDDGNDPAHLETPLPPGSIQRTARPQPELKGIQQPYSSFGGNPREPLNRLNTRVSERLRHKDRALTLWDYERLVLEAFPQVYKVKCLPGEMLRENELGQVVVIVIPNIIGIRPFDPFEPKLPINLLRDIQAYLIERVPAPARIIVQNPVYIQLKIQMSVEFYPEYQADAKYYLERLHQALLEYLAPWAFDTGADIAIGGKVYPSLIVDFVERLSYIDYVKDFRLVLGEEGDSRTATAQEMQEGLIAPHADAIWVSARSHALSATGGSGVGIGYMIIETDFQVI